MASSASSSRFHPVVSTFSPTGKCDAVFTFYISDLNYSVIRKVRVQDNKCKRFTKNSFNI